MKKTLEEKETPEKKKGKRKWRDKLSEERQEEQCAQLFMYCTKTKKGKG